MAPVRSMMNSAGRAMFQAKTPTAMPDAVRLQHVAGLVDQDVERQPGLLDVAAHRLGCLRDDGDHLHAEPGVFR